MPADSGDVQSLSVAGSQVRVAVRAWEVGIEQPAAAVMNDTAAVMNDTPLLTWRRPASVPVRESFWITPSSAGESWPGLPQLRVDELVHVGAPLLVRREGNIDWAAFGDTVHGFLTADRVEDELSARRRRAQRLIAACTSGASVAAESLIAMSGALHAFVKERWPGAIWHRELPIRVCVGAGAAARRVNGEIDILLETDAGYVVIDHKTYGNPDEAALREHAEQYLSQLATYGRALEGLGGKGILGYWLHFGVAGICLQLR